MEPQWGGEKSLKAAEKDHTLTDRVCAFKTSWAECRDQKRCRHRANGGDFSLDIHSYRTDSGRIILARQKARSAARFHWTITFFKSWGSAHQAFTAWRSARISTWRSRFARRLFSTAKNRASNIVLGGG